ncbi:MAG: hypothetical protein JW956_13735 [Calditrichaceae bacterium]|nr:hypothetical protein [Calditrichaceae bacterium]
MDNFLIQFLVITLLFIIVFVSGYRLNRTGKPYNTITFNIHKLIGLAVIAVLVVQMYNTNQISKLSLAEWISSLITGSIFLIAILSGGILSIEKSMPDAMNKIHKIVAYLAIFLTAFTLYLSVNPN